MPTGRSLLSTIGSRRYPPLDMRKMAEATLASARSTTGAGIMTVSIGAVQIVAPLHHAQGVALGKDAGQAAVVADEHGTGAVVFQQGEDFADRSLGLDTQRPMRARLFDRVGRELQLDIHACPSKAAEGRQAVARNRSLSPSQLRGDEPV